jgi:hypothetical protein
VVSCVFALLLAEAILRFTPYDDIRNLKYFNDGLFVNDPELGAAMRPNFEKAWFEFKGPGHWIFTNDLGCFDHPVDTDIDDYIVFLGDSWTWGYTPLEKKFTTRIENELGIRALKCGVTGTGSKYQLTLLKRILARMKHPPRMVVQVYSSNDFNDDFIFPGFRVVEGQRVPRYAKIDLETCRRTRFTRRYLVMNTRYLKHRMRNRRFPEGYSAIYGLVTRAAKRSGRRPTSAETAKPIELSERVMAPRAIPNLLNVRAEESGCIREAFADHLATIEATQAVVQQLGGRYVLFLLSSGRGRPGTYSSELRTFVAENIEYHDTVPGRKPSHLFDGHWNEQGNAVAARSMLTSLREMGLVE